MVERETSDQPREVVAAIKDLLGGKVERIVTTISGGNDVMAIIHQTGGKVSMVEVHYSCTETVKGRGKPKEVTRKGYVAPINPEITVNSDPSDPDQVASLVIKGQKEEVTISREEVTISRGGNVTVQKLVQPKAADGDGVINHDI